MVQTLVEGVRDTLYMSLWPRRLFGYLLLLLRFFLASFKKTASVKTSVIYRIPDIVVNLDPKRAVFDLPILVSLFTKWLVGKSYGAIGNGRFPFVIAAAPFYRAYGRVLNLRSIRAPAEAAKSIATDGTILEGPYRRGQNVSLGGGGGLEHPVP